MTNTRTVAVLGLGKMGTPIAVTLLAAGHRVAVWNRSAGRTAPLVERGAVAAPTVAAAVAGAEVVITSLLDPASVRDVLSGVDLTGAVVVNVTTGGPEDAAALADQVGERGAAYLDGVMMAVPQSIGTPDALLLYSGPAAAFAEARDALEPLGTTHHLGTDPKLAGLYDLALLGAGYTALAGFLHATAMLGTAGVGPGELLPVLRHWLSGIIAFMPELGAEIERRDYAAGVSSVDLNRTALDLIVDTSRRIGVDPVLVLPIQELLARRAKAGHGSESFASLVEDLRTA